MAEAVFTSASHAPRQGLSADKQNCLQNAVLICGAGAFNVKSNSFRVNWSLTACLDVLFKGSGGSGSRRMDTGLQTGRSVDTEERIRAHGLQSCKKAEVHRRKKTTTVFFSSSVWWHIMQQIETWTQSAELSSGLEWKLLKKIITIKNTEIKDGVWPLQGHACCMSSRQSARIRSRRIFFYCCHVHSAP